MSDPLVIAIILNTNRREDTLACLASLHQQDYPELKIIVLDNACTDGSNEAIRSTYPSVQIISLDKNLGYAGNNNSGIKAAVQQGAEWIFVINEDIILANDAIRQLVTQAQFNPAIGIAGPMVYHYDQPRVIQSAGGRMDRLWRTWHRAQNEPDQDQFSQPDLVEWISGCAILVRKPVIDQVGMLDERFFYYFEETEWCVRARKAGWKIEFIPQAKIWHKGVQVDYQPGPNVTYYATRNRFLMMAKHHAPWYAWGYAFAFVFLRPLLSWTLKARWRAKLDHRDAMWQGAVDFFNKRWGIRPHLR